MERDSTLKEHLRVLGVHDRLKLQPFIMIGSDPWIKKRVNYLSCTEGRGGGKNIHLSAQNSLAIWWSIMKYLFFNATKIIFIASLDKFKTIILNLEFPGRKLLEEKIT